MEIWCPKNKDIVDLGVLKLQGITGELSGIKGRGFTSFVGEKEKSKETQKRKKGKGEKE